MTILIRSAHIIDPNSSHHNSVKDILVMDGTLTQIGNNISTQGADEVIEGEDIYVSIGWTDLFATIGDPGFEHRETVTSALNAAANGGFTKLTVSPESLPVCDGKSGIEYLLKQAKGHTVDLLPLGAITKRLEGKEMAEMYDMVKAGAVGISNAKHTISDSKVMQVAMQYTAQLAKPFYAFAEDNRLAAGGQMHEGEVSTGLGLKGIPALAEELAVSRDLYLMRYTGSAIHFSHMTTAGAVSLIRQAKAEGLPVTASVPAHHLLISDASVVGFDSNFKTRPPFRDPKHLTALWEGLADGTLDAIISDHEPLEVELKFMEFGQATPGIVALETLFAALLKAAEGRLTLEALVGKLTTGPRNVLGIPQPKMEEGQSAELTVFSPDVEWQYCEETTASGSHNSPLWKKELQGRAIAVIHNGQIRFSDF